MTITDTDRDDFDATAFDTALARCLHGAEMIDADPNITGDWRSVVRTAIENNKFEMRSECYCTVGHVYDVWDADDSSVAYKNALHQLGVNQDRNEDVDCGFDVDGEVSYDDLARAWRAVVNS